MAKTFSDGINQEIATSPSNSKTLDEILVPLESDEFVFLNQDFDASMEHLFSITFAGREGKLVFILSKKKL